MVIQFAPTIISPVASFWKEGNNSPIVTIKIQHNNQFTWEKTPNLKVKMWRFDDETAENIEKIVNQLKIKNGLFEQVKVDKGGYGISWNGEIDLSCNELWENGYNKQIKHKERYMRW